MSAKARRPFETARTLAAPAPPKHTAGRELGRSPEPARDRTAAPAKLRSGGASRRSTGCAVLAARARHSSRRESRPPATRSHDRRRTARRSARIVQTRASAIGASLLARKTKPASRSTDTSRIPSATHVGMRTAHAARLPETRDAKMRSTLIRAVSGPSPGAPASRRCAMRAA